MKIRVLGPLAIDHNNVSIVPTAGKPRQILTTLALRAGYTVPVATLMEEVWGDEAPRSAATTLQTYILQLRRRLAGTLPAGSTTTPKEILATSFGGYRLTSAVESYDFAEFQNLSTRGSSALEAGDPRTAADLLRRALDLWRGPALGDMPRGVVLELEAISMEESRMQVLEQRIEADLRLGRHSSLIAELRVLTTRHPLNENLSAQLMTAFYYSGSAWRALEEFRRLRDTVNGELGVEPTPRLQALHQAVLSASL